MDISPFQFNATQKVHTNESGPKVSVCLSGTRIPESATVEYRMNSCDSKFAIAAVEEVINDADVISEPLSLFSPASAFYRHGQKDEAVFWFYAAQLRLRQQLIFENGDRGQLLQVMLMTVGQPINNYAFQDTTNFTRILDKVLDWDRRTTNPFREKAKTEDSRKQIEQVYASFHDLKRRLETDRIGLEEQARKAAPAIQQAFTEASAKRCHKS